MRKEKPVKSSSTLIARSFCKLGLAWETRKSKVPRESVMTTSIVPCNKYH